MKKLMILFGISLLLCGCGEEKQDTANEMVTCDKMKQILASDKNALLIDVRNEDEYAKGHLENAINYKYSVVVDELDRQGIDKKTVIIVYCLTGNRSDLAYTQLRNSGYENVYDLGAITNCPGE